MPCRKKERKKESRFMCCDHAAWLALPLPAPFLLNARAPPFWLLPLALFAVAASVAAAPLPTAAAA